MALSRIWSAFIIIAISVAGYHFFFNSSRDDVFSRMMTGTSKDEFKYVSLLDSASTAGIHAQMKDYSYVLQKEADKETRYILADASLQDSAARIQSKFAASRIVTASYILGRKQKPIDGVIETCWTAVEICLKLIGILSLFIGFMSIAEKAGGIRLLSRIVGPFFSRLFPEVPKDHPAHGLMIMNFSANLLGLDNAATPFGLKAMESLQELNPNKAVASNSQIMFLCLHAAGLNLIPVSVIAVRAAQKASDPTDIFVPCMIVTFVGTIAAMIIVSIKQRINLLQPVILAWVFGISALIALLVIYITSLNAAGLQSFSGVLSSGLILLVFLLIILGGLYKKIDVFSSFVDGARNGFDTAIRIIPYILGILVAVSMLRSSGTFDAVIGGIKQFFALFSPDTRFVDALPTALIRPLSGGAARGMMVSTMATYGPDSFASKLSGIFQGASDTTFYVVAVYFGSVSIKNTRYAIGAMLLADLVCVITAITLAYIFFG
ncbi:MAG TPA: nucleoside recognition domain-containing protein [Ferruginibacter sp.]|nr:nucleoside recognition domain-containing protein [Ferruginibacter sp.]HMZ99493.1 nucleoside recognition domain-containing protein [Ferruginibacter sp.]HNF01264.1 nucleoside recognition domain-containing protein [Ferruginibacter sp.]HNF42530.1 nucleoside recognition domain-containing protein [Ferruginibacter sp.]HNJ28051.1 nucleoside recognition domain-containing protein [Ferruginibacter sp.]